MNIEMRITAGAFYKENRLIPILTKVNKNRYRNNIVAMLYSQIDRFTLKAESIVCVASDPEKDRGLFLSKSGEERVIDLAELKSKITYVNARFKKKEVRKFIMVRKKENWDSLVSGFLANPSVMRKYKGWITENGVVGEVKENEVNEMKAESYMVYRDRNDDVFVTGEIKDNNVTYWNTEGKKFTSSVEQFEKEFKEGKDGDLDKFGE